MIIKNTPAFSPILKESCSGNALHGDASLQSRGLDPFAPLMRPPSNTEGDFSGISAVLADFAKTTGTESENSEFSSVLTTLIQLATIPVAATAPAAETPRQQNSLRRAISSYVPKYSTEGLRQKIDFRTRISSPQKPKQPETRASEPLPGFLASHFESTGRNNAIGYDRRGGTCYGIYQLSSRMGTMNTFLKYLDSRAPEWAARLRSTGPANTKGRDGGMPREWQRISKEAPEQFSRLQHDFVHKHYYKPAARAVQRRIGLGPDGISPALREVIWSTAVQHGVAGAANIFERAASRLGLQHAASKETQIAERDLIQAIYAERGKRFTGSSQAVRSSVQERFVREMQLALALLPQTMDRQV